MTLLDKYVFSQTMRRLMISLGIVLLTLVLERVLRLFEFAAANNAAMGLVFQMAANLLPHYLGLALPAAFFISILLFMTRLGDDNELDAILSAGSSVRRMARTLVISGVILAVLSILLLGYLQPYSRYAYRAVRHVATHAVWNEAITAQKFFSPATGLTILADDVDFGGRGLGGVFVHQISDDQRETIITATTGEVETDELTGNATIILRDVVQLIEQPGRAPYTLFLKELVYRPDFPFQPAPFRDRGKDQRELTLGELWARSSQLAVTGEDKIERTRNIAELHARLVRSFSVAAMPFLAVPMGISAKRRSRGLTLATAAVLLLSYHFMLQFGEGFVSLGVVSPLVGLWLPFIAFTLFCIHLFLSVDQRLRPNRFDQLFDGLDRVVQFIKERILPKRQSSK